MILFFVSSIAFLLAGFGLGGGVLLIPVLTSFFEFNQIDAQYTAILAYIPASIAVIIFNFKANKGNAKNVLKLIPYGILGAIAGSYLISVIPVDLLKKFYGCFLILYGAHMIFGVIIQNKNKKTVKNK